MSNFGKNSRFWPNIDEYHEIFFHPLFCLIQIPKTWSANFLAQHKNKGLTQLLPCYRYERPLCIGRFVENLDLPVYTIVRNLFRHIDAFFYRLHHKELSLDRGMSLVENLERFCASEYDNPHLQQLDCLRRYKDLKVTAFKFEEVSLSYDFIIDPHRIDSQLGASHHNKNPSKEYKHSDIQSFFRSKKIVDLIVEEPSAEFEVLDCPTDLSGILSVYVSVFLLRFGESRLVSRFASHQALGVLSPT